MYCRRVLIYQEVLVNNRLLLLAGALVVSFTTVSFAASPLLPGTNAVVKPSTDVRSNKSNQPPKVRTTSGAIQLSGNTGFEKNSISDPGADFQNQKPGSPDPKVQTTSGKTHSNVNTGFEKNTISDPSADFQNQKPGSPDPKVQTTSRTTHVPNPVGQNNDIGAGQ